MSTADATTPPAAHAATDTATGAHTGADVDARRHATPYGQRPATGGPTLPARATRRAFSGAVVAVEPPPDVCAALALSPDAFPDAPTARVEEPGDLHVTLAFLGDAATLRANIPLVALAEFVATAARTSGPLEARIAGLGRFTSVPDGTPHVLYAAVDAPGLTALVERLYAALAACGAPADATHGFTPHITLAYLDAETPTPATPPPALTWTIREIWLLVASGTPDAQYWTFPLGPETGAPLPDTQATLAERATGDTTTDTTGDDGEGDTSTTDTTGDGGKPEPPADLVAALLDAYGLDDDETTELGRRLYTARVDAFTQRLTATLAPLGVHPPSPWTPPKGWLATQAQGALDTARGIRDTYHDDLRRAIITLALAYYAQHNETWPTAKALAGAVGQWAQARAAWKAEQIGRVETRDAGQAAVDLVHKLLPHTPYGNGATPLGPDGVQRFQTAFDEYFYQKAAEDWTFDWTLDELQSPQLADCEVLVLPESSSEDECLDYAGESFPIDDYNDIPIPMHLGCVHSKYIVLQNGETLDETQFDDTEYD